MFKRIGFVEWSFIVAFIVMAASILFMAKPASAAIIDVIEEKNITCATMTDPSNDVDLIRNILTKKVGVEPVEVPTDSIHAVVFEHVLPKAKLVTVADMEKGLICTKVMPKGDDV